MTARHSIARPRAKNAVIPSEVEGSRDVTFKVASRDCSTPLRSAHNDGVVLAVTIPIEARAIAR
ncbi:MAG: hypothetical protein JO354_03875 [Verrucomicrobia bacterium]|nr:hypothetical protein [Verrucomicrobiota bacterium]